MLFRLFCIICYSVYKSVEKYEQNKKSMHILCTNCIKREKTEIFIVFINMYTNIYRILRKRKRFYGFTLFSLIFT